MSSLSPVNEVNGVNSAVTVLYFAYGSNLLRERIIINNPTAQFCGLGMLRGYTFRYDAPVEAVGYDKDYWLGATATIRPASHDSYVWGVIWEIDVAGIEALDTQETLYQPIQVDVENNKGQIIQCRTYEMNKITFDDPKPSPHYKAVIIAGARQNGLPEKYIQFLESFPDNGVTQTPPLYQKVLDTVRRCRDEADTENVLDHWLAPLKLDSLKC